VQPPRLQQRHLHLHDPPPFTCDDNNACTKDTCNGTAIDHVCINSAPTCDLSDICNPYVCNASVGCVKTPMNCDDSNACTTDTCSNVGGVATCSHQSKSCPTVDFCYINSCNITTGSCFTTEKSCDDSNACTKDTCNNGTCSNIAITCGDICHPSICNTTTGACVPLPLRNCDDGNACTTDTWVCTPTGQNCTYSQISCDDRNNCTIDHCNGSAPSAAQACYTTPYACAAPDICTVNTGCNPIAPNGSQCLFAPLDCTSVHGYNGTDWCHPVSCDKVGGCINIAQTCPNEDRGCFVAACVSYTNQTATSNGTGECQQNQRPDFNTATGKGGVLCPLLYNPTAKAAAISGGVLAGVVIGAVAAAALVGFGGKQGYDYLMNKNSPIGQVDNNPLYAPSGSSGQNALYSS